MASMRLVALREIRGRLEERRYQPKGVADYDFGWRRTRQTCGLSPQLSQMRLEPRQEIPDVPVQPCHLTDGLGHFVYACVVERLGFPEPEISTGLHQAHRLGLRNFTAAIDGIHTVIELVPNVRSLIETFDEVVEFSAERLVLDLDPGQPLDEVKPCPSRVERREQDGCRNLIRFLQQHQNEDEQAFVVGPVEHHVADQREDRRPTICGSRRCSFERCEIRFGRKVADGHGRASHPRGRPIACNVMEHRNVRCRTGGRPIVILSPDVIVS